MSIKPKLLEIKMTPEQFCYWLQGRAELILCPPSQMEWELIREHLKTVFTKVTPALDAPNKNKTYCTQPLDVDVGGLKWSDTDQRIC